MNVTRLSGVLAVFILLILSSFQLQAQDLGGIDFESVNVDNLSDTQIEQIWERAQEENLTVQQLGAMAQARGMSPGEVSKLRSRISQVRSQTGTGNNEPQTEMMRQGDGVDLQDTLRVMRTIELPDSLARERQVFGANLFRDRSISFEPSMNIPTPIDYTLGAGDELVVNVWGAAEASYDLTITPEGNVRIPSLGPIQLDGLSIQDARERIKNRLRDIYSGLRPDDPQNATTYAEISLGNVRSIKVTILGEVNQPGTYTVSSLST
ncbi:MAG: polysaccharide biosynthesis/export family protein, partial [Balneolaceae bacterium]